MKKASGSLGLLMLLTASCGGVVETIDGSSGVDGGAPAEVPDGSPPDLPDTGPPTCADPDRWYRDLDGDLHGDPAASVESCDPVEGFVESGNDCDDACESCHPGASEACDGRDNDCDGAIDQSFACVAGAMIGCTTDCGTAGTGGCTAGCAIPSGAACAPPAELCNGADDDCDGAIDDGFTCAAGGASVCTTACGSIGTGACTSACEPAAPSACAPPAETCNGMDDDCDGSVDQSFACALGASVSCTTSCGTTGSGACTSACAVPTGAACAPPAEACNGIDDDCDGSADDGFTCAAGSSASCTTSCGSTGTGSCTSACMPPGVSACAAPSETCTYADDDCDGIVDEGVLRAGPRSFHPDYYEFARPRVARVGGGLYAAWRMNSWAYLWELDEEGDPTGTRVTLTAGRHFDLEANGGGAVLYAYVDNVTGDVHAGRVSNSPTTADPFDWSRTIDTDVDEVHLAVGSTYAWIYTWRTGGEIAFHTVDLSSGAIVGSRRFVGNSDMRPSVWSNGYRKHVVAFSASDYIYWFQYDMDGGSDGAAWVAVDGARLHDFAVAGDFRPATTRQGIVIAYTLVASATLPAELRYYSWRSSTSSADQRIATGTVASTAQNSQLDLEMADGIGLLGAVWTSSSTASTGTPRVYQLSRQATGAAYTINTISLSLPSAAHEGVSVIRYPDSRGTVPDRIFYNPTENGTASIPIGCF